MQTIEDPFYRRLAQNKRRQFEFALPDYKKFDFLIGTGEMTVAEYARFHKTDKIMFVPIGESLDRLIERLQIH